MGYYETQAEALTALAHFNENPYDIEANKITFAEVFEKWSAEHYPKISKSNVQGYNASYLLCDQIKGLRFNDIKKNHLQGVVDDCGKNYPTLRKLKVLFTMFYKFALQNDICSKTMHNTLTSSNTRIKTLMRSTGNLSVKKKWKQCGNGKTLMNISLSF